ncbi:RHS repeat domain-containing protein [Paraburkholderia hayleyella]|uniref:RHS repeat domain-containing protein n=1 Tax=Paraburkholderia hayleyella TaxID=2152889 RepID=UPI001290C804|nr:RHS repeat domain-containing protein [Paraburkholderia hayleyella]
MAKYGDQFRLHLTFVTDALGYTTQQYYDIDGYPYRVVYPDQTGEWFFRDAAKNITHHAYPDGAEEQFTWDARGNLASHTACDGRTYFVHGRHDMRRGASRYAYDPLGRLTWAQSSLGVETFAFDPASNSFERDERDKHGMVLSTTGTSVQAKNH